jgi:para-nitrobenzyl esterase
MTVSIRAGAACAALALGLALAGCGGGDDDTPPEQRSTAFGTVVGTNDAATTGTYSWKGVPYAKPPVGTLRWAAPVDPDPWMTAKATQSFGNACVQSGRLYGPGLNNRYDETIGTTLGQTLGSEDCLYLNIWQPASATGPLPVVVWVHGGSNISGYTADPMYDGANLARTGNVVVVSVNYRLGVFGFLNMAQLKTGDTQNDSGDFAILDIVKALKWVNANIAAFGGDPKNVTLMGQSAGAVDVYAVMVSPLVADANPSLVHRAVPISGGLSLASELPAGSIATMAPASAYAGQAAFLLQQLVIADGLATDNASAQTYIASQTPEQIATYLRGKSADAVLTTVRTKLAPIGASGSGPIPDGNVVPTSAITAIQAGDYTKVPVLAGNTRDEGKLFPSFFPLAGGTGSGRLLDDATVFSTAFHYDPNSAPQTTLADWIPAQYLPTTTPVTGFDAVAQNLTDIFFIASRDSILNALKSQQDNVWAYRFDWDEEPAPFNEIYGAAHAFDLPFLFGNFGPSLYANISYTTANEPGRLALSDTMMKTLGAFALKGDPNNPSLGVTWPVWPAVLVFDATPTEKVITVE